MASLLHQRCFHHSLREAVARCPSCRQHYCRECVTEHEDRILCTNCLRQMTSAPVARARSLLWLWLPMQGATAIVLLFLLFYFLGTLLLMVPSSFHEGSIWVDNWWKG